MTQNFFIDINKKLRKKEAVNAIKVGDPIYEDKKEICEILNENFQKVFPQEKNLKRGMKREVS